MVSNDGTYTFTPTADTRLQQHCIRGIVDSPGMGSVTASSVTFITDPLTIIATPNEGYAFAGWYSGRRVYSQYYDADAGWQGRYEVQREHFVSGSPVIGEKTMLDIVSRSPSIHPYDRPSLRGFGSDYLIAAFRPE